MRSGLFCSGKCDPPGKCNLRARAPTLTFDESDFTAACVVIDGDDRHVPVFQFFLMQDSDLVKLQGYRIVPE